MPSRVEMGNGCCRTRPFSSTYTPKVEPVPMAVAMAMTYDPYPALASSARYSLLEEEEEDCFEDGKERKSLFGKVRIGFDRIRKEKVCIKISDVELSKEGITRYGVRTIENNRMEAKILKSLTDGFEYRYSEALDAQWILQQNVNPPAPVPIFSPVFRTPVYYEIFKRMKPKTVIGNGYVVPAARPKRYAPPLYMEAKNMRSILREGRIWHDLNGYLTDEDEMDLEEEEKEEKKEPNDTLEFDLLPNDENQDDGDDDRLVMVEVDEETADDLFHQMSQQQEEQKKQPEPQQQRTLKPMKLNFEEDANEEKYNEGQEEEEAEKQLATLDDFVDVWLEEMNTDFYRRMSEIDHYDDDEYSY